MQRNTLLVTGGSQGLGKGILESLPQSSYATISTYKSTKPDHSNESARPAGTQYHLDLSSPSSIDAFCQDLNNTYDQVDTLICNAGIDYYHESIDEITLEEWQEVFAVKLFGHVQLIQSLLPLLKKSHNPNIIFISASLADRPDPLDPAYSSVSAAIDTYARSLVYALKDFSIRTNIICPGPMDTGLSYWKGIKAKDDSIFESLKNSNPVGALTQASDVTAAISTIIENKMLNGNTFYVNGGAHLRP